MFEEFDQLPTSRFKPTNYNPFQVKHRKRTTNEQFDVLEHVFKSNIRPGMEIRKELAGRLGMTCRAVQVWFQNRRAKLKNKRAANEAEGLGRPYPVPMTTFGASPISQIIKSKATLKGPRRLSSTTLSTANELMGKIRLSGRVQSCPDIGKHFEHLKDAIQNQASRRNSSPVEGSPTDLFMLPYSMMLSHQPSMAMMAPMTPDSLAMEELNYLPLISSDYCFPSMMTPNANNTFSVPLHTGPFPNCLVEEEYAPSAELLSGNLMANGGGTQDYENYANYPFLFSGC